MKIKNGKHYVNKTWRYLTPCLKGHGEDFISKFNSIFKLAVGIHDTLLDGSKLSNKKSIFIMCDKSYNKYNFYDFLDWVKNEPYFLGDYCPEAELKGSNKHVIILEIPEKYHKAYDSFLRAKYSQMFTKEEVSSLFSSPGKKEEKYVLLKHRAGVLNLIKSINKEFDCNYKLEDYDYSGEELELPLNKCQEIFNCHKEQTTYFNEKIDKVWQY